MSYQRLRLMNMEKLLLWIFKFLSYFSNSAKGYARYGRVYNKQKNLYPALYNYMFEWFKTKEFQTYLDTPSGYISVCKNYEADANGTYLGIFTCPLPFVPKDHSYCCGVEDAQYCCKFWDLPLNVAAVVVVSLMGLGIIITSIYIFIHLCINKKKKDMENNKRKALRRIGLLRKLGRKASSWSLTKLFDQMHAESTYSESSFKSEEDQFYSGDEYFSNVYKEKKTENEENGSNVVKSKPDSLESKKVAFFAEKPVTQRIGKQHSNGMENSVSSKDLKIPILQNKKRKVRKHRKREEKARRNQVQELAGVENNIEIYDITECFPLPSVGGQKEYVDQFDYC